MTAVTVDDILSWLEETFLEVTEEGSLSLVGLVHYSSTGAETALDSASSKMPADKWNPAAMSTRFHAVANRYAKGIVGGGMQQFRLGAVFGGSTKPSRFLPFLLMGGSAPTAQPFGGFSSEGTAPHQLMATATRWGELSIQGSHQMMMHTATVMQGLVGKLVERLDQTETKLNTQWDAMRALYVAMLEQGNIAAAHALKVQFAKQIVPLMPGLVNALSGKEIFPSSTVEKSVFDEISKRVPPEQQAALVGYINSQPNGEALGAIIADGLTKARSRQAAEASAEQSAAATAMHMASPVSYEQALRDAGGDLRRVMVGDVAKELPQKTNGHSNGNGASNGESPPSEGQYQAFVGELFDAATPQQIEMLAGLYESQGKKPLADNLRKLYAESKETK